jgi:hypothetical protein
MAEMAEMAEMAVSDIFKSREHLKLNPCPVAYAALERT